MKIAVTGHRPNRIYGYNITNSEWMNLKEQFKTLLKQYDCDEAYTGMALGVDTVFALAVLELRNEGYDIKLHCAIPCRNHPCRWPKESQDMYHKILEQADIVTLVTDEPFKPELMLIRNCYMVDHVDVVIAVWDGGERGGTAHCVRYAAKKDKEVVVIKP